MGVWGYRWGWSGGILGEWDVFVGLWINGSVIEVSFCRNLPFICIGRGLRWGYESG